MNIYCANLKKSIKHELIEKITLNKKVIIVKWLSVQLALLELIIVSYIADSIILFLVRNSVSLLKRERLYEFS